jgi:uncharacterized protein (DUF58 family)
MIAASRPLAGRIRGIGPRLRRWFQGKLRRAPVGPNGVARIAARQIYILPTPTGLLYALIVMAMVLGSLNFQNNLGLLFGFFMAGVGLVAMHRCWFNLLGLEAQVRPGPPVFAGSPAQFEVTLHNGREGDRYDVRVLGGLDGVRPVHLAARDQRSVTVAVTSERRGRLPLLEVEIETRHPMHLFRAWSYTASQAVCVIYPRPAARAPDPNQDSGGATRPGRSGGEGAEDYVGPRPYRHGDSPKHLDWKALARERGLVVKQFGEDQGLEVWIDWSALAVADPERRIRLLTRQVLDAAASSLRFGLRLPGVEIGLGRGETQVQCCLTELAFFRHANGQTDTDRRAA